MSDTAQDVLWFNNGAWRLRSKCGVTGCIQTRPLLELHIRRRIEKLPNVIQLYGVSAKGLEMDATKSRVAGVHIAEDGGAEKILPADLVVDCSGRGSKTPAWLEAAGLGKPPVTVVVVNVGLLDRVFSRSRKESSRLARHADLGEGAEGVPGELVRFSAMSHCYTEAKQQFANHRWSFPQEKPGVRATRKTLSGPINEPERNYRVA